MVRPCTTTKRFILVLSVRLWKINLLTLWFGSCCVITTPDINPIMIRWIGFVRI